MLEENDGNGENDGNSEFAFNKLCANCGLIALVCTCLSESEEEEPLEDEITGTEGKS